VRASFSAWVSQPVERVLFDARFVWAPAVSAWAGISVSVYREGRRSKPKGSSVLWSASEHGVSGSGSGCDCDCCRLGSGFHRDFHRYCGCGCGCDSCSGCDFLRPAADCSGGGERGCFLIVFPFLEAFWVVLPSVTAFWVNTRWFAAPDFASALPLLFRERWQFVAGNSNRFGCTERASPRRQICVREREISSFSPRFSCRADWVIGKNISPELTSPRVVKSCRRSRATRNGRPFERRSFVDA